MKEMFQILLSTVTVINDIVVYELRNRNVLFIAKLSSLLIELTITNFNRIY